MVQLGNKYLLKVPGKTLDDGTVQEDEIVAEFGNMHFAKIKAKAMAAGCTVKRCGLHLPYHVRFMLDEFANSVTRSTPKTVGITDKSVA